MGCSHSILVGARLSQLLNGEVQANFSLIVNKRLVMASLRKFDYHNYKS